MGDYALVSTCFLIRSLNYVVFQRLPSSGTGRSPYSVVEKRVIARHENKGIINVPDMHTFYSDLEWISSSDGI